MIGYTLGFLAGLAWLTHVIYCIQNLLWGMLIAGGVVFPVGIIHGVLLWFGAA